VTGGKSVSGMKKNCSIAELGIGTSLP
jgi:hypothetical protein